MKSQVTKRRAVVFLNMAKQSSKQSSQLNQYTNNSKHQQLQLQDSK